MFAINISISLNAEGLHGCHRDKGDGEIIQGHCEQPACPDCLTRDYIAALRAQGHSITSFDGSIVHYPGLPTQVTDNLLSNVRQGKFY